MEDKTSSQPDSEKDIILVSHTIDRELHYKLTKLLNKRQKKTNKKCTLFLTTFGGDPHAGYRIARCLRHHYEHLRLVIPSYCKSAGTLITISADELAIGDLGELGPLDIQVSKPSEIQERASGLDIIQALEAIQLHSLSVFRATLLDIRLGARLSTRMAGEFASKVAIGAAESLYAQIDPNKLGEMQRAMQITFDYGSRLNNHSNNLNENTLSELVGGYPSHSFVIDRKEAKELFNNVDHPTELECALSEIFWEKFQTETNFGPQLIGEDAIIALLKTNSITKEKEENKEHNKRTRRKK
jgi:Serine dehydrogenase proteinase